MSAANFPDSQTLGMQREALRRVREMQLRARQSVEQANGFSEPYGWGTANFSTQPENAPFAANSASPQQNFQQSRQNTPLSNQSMPNQAPSNQQAPQANQPQSGPSPQQSQATATQTQFNQQQNRQQRPNTPPSNNILAHLFGGGRQQGPMGGGVNNLFQQASGQSRSPNGSGLLDLLRRQGLGDSVSGLGETLQTTISSVSEPLSNLLGSFGIDGEKLIILMVMWAIFNEHKENKTLLLALGYLLL